MSTSKSNNPIQFEICVDTMKVPKKDERTTVYIVKITSPVRSKWNEISKRIRSLGSPFYTRKKDAKGFVFYHYMVMDKYGDQIEEEDVEVILDFLSELIGKELEDIEPDAVENIKLLKIFQSSDGASDQTIDFIKEQQWNFGYDSFGIQINDKEYGIYTKKGKINEKIKEAMSNLVSRQ